MKRIFLLVLALLAFSNLNAQIKVDENFVFDPGDDSTKFVLFPIMVTDTAEVWRVVDAYRLQKEAEFDEQINTIKEEIKSIAAILRAGKIDGILSSDDGSQETYEKLFYELANNSERAQLFLQSPASEERKGTSAYSYKTWKERYKRDSKKAERLMKNKHMTQPVIIEYAEWVEQQNFNLINDLGAEKYRTCSGITFGQYPTITGSNTMPKKQIYVQRKNPYYVPSLAEEFASVPYWEAFKTIKERDIKKQEQGWEWINGVDYERIESKYPYEYRAEKYPSHPEYLVLYHFNIYDLDGNLVRIRSVKDLDEITQELTHIQYQKDYLSNKYNILSEDSEVQYVVTNKLGLSSEYAENVVGIFGDAFAHDLGTRYGTLRQRLDSYRKLEKDSFKVLAEAFRMLNDKAIRFCDQLRIDHENDYKYVLSSQRLSDLSFKITFGTQDFKPTSAVTVEYYAPTPFVVAKFRIIKIEEY